MTTIHAGATLERPPGPKYRDALHFAELRMPEPLPRAATLAQWGEQLSSRLALSLVVPRAAVVSEAGALRFDDALEEALRRCVEGADALGAQFVVLPTGPEITTGQRDRDRVAAWFERWPAREGRRMVWHPTGLWDPELARPFARKLGVLHALDPLEHELPRGAELLYARLQAIGLRGRFTETLLLDALDALSEAEVDEAYVAIESPRSFQEARRLAALAGDAGAGAEA